MYVPGYEGQVGTWRDVRARCKSMSNPSLRWVPVTEINLRRTRDWASDTQQMRADRVQAIDQLRKENEELVQTVQTLKGLLEMTKGRTCFGSH